MFARGPWPRSKHDPMHNFGLARPKIILSYVVLGPCFFIFVLWGQSTRPDLNVHLYHGLSGSQRGGMTRLERGVVALGRCRLVAWLALGTSPCPLDHLDRGAVAYG